MKRIIENHQIQCHENVNHIFMEKEIEDEGGGEEPPEQEGEDI